MNTTDSNRDEAITTCLAADLDGSFERLVLAYQDRIYAFVLRMTMSGPDAEEAAQDTFVRAYRALRRYDPERIREMALRPWLYSIALNVCRNRARRARPPETSLDAAIGDEDGDGFDVAGDEREQPETVVERLDERERLSALVATLPERYRVALLLRFMSGLAYAEIAAALSQPVGTAKANVHRGIRLLRERMAAEEEADRDNWRNENE